MGKVEGRFVIILNVDRVLSTEEITMLASMSGNGSGNDEE
jgi:purine-binding chemotaxis protein CheW